MRRKTEGVSFKKLRKRKIPLLFVQIRELQKSFSAAARPSTRSGNILGLRADLEQKSAVVREKGGMTDDTAKPSREG